MSIPLVDSLNAQEIASACLATDVEGEEQQRQAMERIEILRCWLTPESDEDDHVESWSEATLVGKTVVEIGCGQGDATAVLASLMHKAGGGTVYAVDPGPLDYGSPFTLGQAQGHLAGGPLGAHIRFIQADAPTFFRGLSPGKVDVLVLMHSLWYFKSIQHIREMVAAAMGNAIPIICLAEWTLGDETTPEADRAAAHRAAVQLQLKYPGSGGNIYTVLHPATLTAVMEEHGYHPIRERVLSSPSLKDGEWEVAMSRGRLHALCRMASEKRQTQLVDQISNDLTALDAVCPPAGHPVPTLDVWTGVFAR